MLMILKTKILCNLLAQNTQRKEGSSNGNQEEPSTLQADLPANIGNGARIHLKSRKRAKILSIVAAKTTMKKMPGAMAKKEEEEEKKARKP